MKKYLLFSLLLVIGLSDIFAQEVISSTFLTTRDKDYFTNQFGITPFTGTDLYRIQYTTHNVEGVLDTASGLVCIPQVEGLRVPIVSYSHGTVGSRFLVPSYLSGESIVASIYSAVGTVCLAADYLGLGDNKGIHPYMHAASTASVSLDMIKAVKTWLPSQMGLETNDQLFITGYSQGGHAAMALHRLIETETDIEVTGSIPMSGPYSISTGMRDLLLSEDDYVVVAYLAQVAISYQKVYGDIYPNGEITQFFKPEYIEDIQKFINEEIDLWELNDILITKLTLNEGGAISKKMIFDSIVEDIISQDNHPVNVALRDNDVYDWAPVGDMRLLYCEGDDQIGFNNSLIAKQTMNANGAEHVVAINLNSAFNHSECVQPAITVMYFYLNQLTMHTSAEDLEKTEVMMYPNPSNGDFIISFDNDISNVLIDVYAMTGTKVQSVNNVENRQAIALNVAPGLYIINIKNKNGQLIAVEKLVVQ